MLISVLAKAVLAITLTISGLRTLYYLQLKEYRIDRLIDFVKYDKGKKILLNPVSLGLLALALISLKLPFATYLLIPLAAIWQYLNLKKSGLLRFKPTAKATAIFASYLFVILIAFASLWPLALVYLAAPAYLILVVLILNPITKLAKEITIYRAKKKLQALENLIVIGITGSYGKSSTKEFLATVLSTKYKVLKTPKNINTDIGIARLILDKLDPTYQVFVVEMGAYRKGEIQNIVKMLTLNFAIITAIAPQHLSLFGSFENIKAAKSEIVNGIRKDGFLFLNLDSLGVQEVVPNLKFEQVITYGENSHPDLEVKEILQEDQSLSFKLKNYKYQTTLFGSHNAVNLAPVIGIAEKLGLETDEIKTALKLLVNPENTLNIKQSIQGHLVIDDSYNANLDGFLAAIKYVLTFKKRSPKILVTRGLYELGPLEKEAHTQIAAEALNAFDTIILLRPTVYKYFKDEAIRTKSKTKLFCFENPTEIIKLLQKYKQEKALILLENRVFAAVEKYLFDQES